MKRRRISAPYLYALRRRSGLSQEDVAFLLGALEGTRVSRHETGICTPPLRIVLAYAVMFNVAAADIYEGEVQRICRDLACQATKLRKRLAYRVRDPLRERKMKALAEIIERCAHN